VLSSDDAFRKIGWKAAPPSGVFWELGQFEKNEISQNEEEDIKFVKLKSSNKKET